MKINPPLFIEYRRLFRGEGKKRGKQRRKQFEKTDKTFLKHLKKEQEHGRRKSESEESEV